MAFIPDAAVDNMEALSSGAWKLYCFLCRCRNGKTGRVFPSVRISASAIKVHEKNIFKLRKELEALNWAKFEGDDVKLLKGFDSSENATTVIVSKRVMPDSSKNTTNDQPSSKNATQESQKHYPVVAKTLPDGSKNTTAYKEEPAKEPAKEPIPAAPAAARESSPDTEEEQSEGYAHFKQLVFSGYAAALQKLDPGAMPYVATKADWVQLAAFRKKCVTAKWELTPERLQLALANYTSSPIGVRTMADFCVRFSDYFRSRFDRFGKPEPSKQAAVTAAANAQANLCPKCRNRGDYLNENRERVKCDCAVVQAQKGAYVGRT